MKMRLSISTAITLFGLILAVGFASVVLTGAFALKELKVGGPLYASIKLGNDLVADILPPPAYVIEAYLEATLALREPKNAELHEKKLAQLKKDYEDRKTFWTSSDLQPGLKALLVEQSDSEVRKFWQILETEMLPALHKAAAERATRHSDVSDLVVPTGLGPYGLVRGAASLALDHFYRDPLALLGHR